VIEVTTDKVLYEPGEDIEVSIRIDGLVSSESVDFVVIKDSREIVQRAFQAVPPEFNFIDYIKLGDTGFYEIVIKCCGDESRVPIMITERPESPIRLIIAFHNHQPIHKYPNGHYHGLWAFYHTWSQELQPIYDVGPYLLHARLVDKYRVSITYNLSPSLLWQWDDALKNGILIEGEDYIGYVSPRDPRMELIREARDTYSRLAKDGVIEVLTSFIAHPIAGYLIEKYGIDELLRWELEVGREVTKEVLGVDAVGMWLPELYFSERLKDMLCNEGIKYIVLDGVYHLGENIKDRGSLFKLYKHDCLTILFRDTALSDLLSFQLNKAGNAREADVNARRLIIEMAMRGSYAKGGVVTMALDGENWMVLPSPNPYAALLLEKILFYLSRAGVDGYIIPIRPSAIIDEAQEEIRELPTTSWLGSPNKWVSERAEVQSRLWSMAQLAINKWRIYEEVFGEDYDLRMSLAMTLDSDYYWAEFVNVEHVGSWAFNTVKIVNEALSALTLRIIEYDKQVEIIIGNKWVKDASLVINVESPETNLEHNVKVPSGSLESLKLDRTNNMSISILTPRTKTPIIKTIRVLSTNAQPS